VLKQRVLTALALAAVVIYGVLALPSNWFGVFCGVAVFIGGMEWTRLLRLDAADRMLWCTTFAVLLCSAVFGSERFIALLVAGAAVFWLLCAPVWLVRFAAQPQRRDSQHCWAWIGLLVLVGPLAAVTQLHRADGWGPAYVLLLIALVAAADIGAFFVGRRFGRVKLAPTLSPGKTREGAWGALAAAVLTAVVGALWIGLPLVRWPLFLIVCLVTVVVSIAGDLFESMLKRQHGAKDSGQLLPGHGGILDRLDSLAAAAPVFVMGLWLTGC